jgi:hypothetical protein
VHGVLDRDYENGHWTLGTRDRLIDNGRGLRSASAPGTWRRQVNSVGLLHMGKLGRGTLETIYAGISPRPTLEALASVSFVPVIGRAAAH